MKCCYMMRQIFKKKSTYVNPVKIFKSDDLPAPDGPIIAVSSPERNSPDTPFSTFLVSKREWIQI